MQFPPYTIDIALAVLAVFAIVQNMLLRRRLKKIFRGSNGEDMEQVLRVQKNKIQQLETKTGALTEHTTHIADTLTRAVRKVSMMRFNSFEKQGANQSFTIAALNGKHDGFILTGLQMREQMRLYLKAVKSGVTEEKLSQEEERVLREAMTQE